MATTNTAAKTALPTNVFAVEVPNHELLKLAYDSYLANARLASATTKQRGAVVVSFSVLVAMKTTPKSFLRLASA